VITEQKKWLTYTYFNRNPGFFLTIVHLFSPVKKNITGMKRISFPTMVIDIRDENFKDTWSKSTRHDVNRAEKDDLTIKRGKELLSDILALFEKTAASKGLRGYKVGDFNSRPWIECSAVFFENKMLAAHVWLKDMDEKRTFFYVNVSRHREPGYDPAMIGRAHYYLLWQDGMHFRNQGIETMDLMGYDPNKTEQVLAGVNAWKEGTNGKQVELYHYYPTWFYWLKKLRKK